MIRLKASLKFLPDLAYIKLYYRLRVGHKLNIDHPRTFNEKIQWMKFNYRNPLYTIVSDKVLVREYVKEKIGEQYLIPMLGCWEKFEDIDFHKLPDQFVLKCNHDSGGLVVCTDKKKLNMSVIKRKITSSLKRNFYWVGREYQYKNIKPLIYCEEFLSEDGRVPADYKIYCFNGKPDCVMVCVDRFSESHRAKYYYYDTDWNFFCVTKGEKMSDNPHTPAPENLAEMLEVAARLSEDFIYARIDLYNVHGKIYFGEITLSPNSGFDGDMTDQADLMFGEKLQIPYSDLLFK